MNSLFFASNILFFNIFFVFFLSQRTACHTVIDSRIEDWMQSCYRLAVQANPLFFFNKHFQQLQWANCIIQSLCHSPMVSMLLFRQLTNSITMLLCVFVLWESMSFTYRISSNKTRLYYFFTRPSTVGIIRMWVLIEGWYYYQIQRHLHTYYVSKTRVFAWRHKEQT